jgi:hypothetical protein
MIPYERLAQAVEQYRAQRANQAELDALDRVDEGQALSPPLPHQMAMRDAPTQLDAKFHLSSSATDPVQPIAAEATVAEVYSPRGALTFGESDEHDMLPRTEPALARENPWDNLDVALAATDHYLAPGDGSDADQRVQATGGRPARDGRGEADLDLFRPEVAVHAGPEDATSPYVHSGEVVHEVHDLDVVEERPTREGEKRKRKKK